jgi:polyisoprenoid-binding protein YceI
MKKVILLSAFFMATLGATAQKWSVDKSHSNVGFTLTHLLISEVDGNFNDIDASFTSVKNDFSDAIFSFTAQVSSVDTRIERRDNHLRNADYFDVEKYATMAFKSTSFKHSGGEKYSMAGYVTIKGVTKPLTLDVTLKGPVLNQRSKKQMVGIKASGTLDRFDFNVGSEFGKTVGREITIHANGEFSKE